MFLVEQGQYGHVHSVPSNNIVSEEGAMELSLFINGIIWIINCIVRLIDGLFPMTRRIYRELIVFRFINCTIRRIDH